MSARKRKPYDTMNKFMLSVKTTTREGKREYMRLYMRMRRTTVADIVGLRKKRK